MTFKPTYYTLWKNENDLSRDLLRCTQKNAVWPLTLEWEKIGDIKVYNSNINRTMIEHLAEGKGCLKITRIALRMMEGEGKIKLLNSNSNDCSSC